jgi:hypothetical protein
LSLGDCELYSAHLGSKEHFHEVFLARAAALVAKNDRAAAEPLYPPASGSSLESLPAFASPGGGGLPAAFSRALCHVHRLRADAQAALRGSSSASPHGPATRKSARVLVLQAAGDRDAQYNQAMNCIFAAHAMDVVVRPAINVMDLEGGGAVD